MKPAPRFTVGVQATQSIDLRSFRQSTTITTGLPPLDSPLLKQPYYTTPPNMYRSTLPTLPEHLLAVEAALSAVCLPAGGARCIASTILQRTNTCDHCLAVNYTSTRMLQSGTTIQVLQLMYLASINFVALRYRHCSCSSTV